MPEIALGLASRSVSIDGRALIGLGAISVTELCQTANGYTVILGVRLRVIRPVVKRETAQTIS